MFLVVFKVIQIDYGLFHKSINGSAGCKNFNRYNRCNANSLRHCLLRIAVMQASIHCSCRCMFAQPPVSSLSSITFVVHKGNVLAQLQLRLSLV